MTNFITIIIYSLLLSVINCITTIWPDDTAPDQIKVWKDDFAYDNGGWNNTHIVNGSLRKYHGWLSNNTILSRQFQSLGLNLKYDISFTVYYLCGTNYADTNGISWYLNGQKWNVNTSEFILYDAIMTANSDVDHTYEVSNENIANKFNCQGHDAKFQAQDFSYSIKKEDQWNFTLSFYVDLSSTNATKYVGISNIQITTHMPTAVGIFIFMCCAIFFFSTATLYLVRYFYLKRKLQNVGQNITAVLTEKYMECGQCSVTYSFTTDVKNDLIGGYIKSKSTVYVSKDIINLCSMFIGDSLKVGYGPYKKKEGVSKEYGKTHNVNDVINIRADPKYGANCNIIDPHGSKCYRNCIKFMAGAYLVFSIVGVIGYFMIILEYTTYAPICIPVPILAVFSVVLFHRWKNRNGNVYIHSDDETNNDCQNNEGNEKSSLLVSMQK